MDKEEFDLVLDLAKAEKSAADIASVVRAFRAEMKKETLTGMSDKDIDELSMVFGKTLILRLLLPPESSDEDDIEN